MPTTRIKTQVNVLEKRGDVFRRTDNFIPQDTTIATGTPEKAQLGRRLETILPVVWKGRTYYIVERELDF